METYNPIGLGKGGDYFVYKGIKVCLAGQSEKIQARLDTPLYAHERMNVGRVEGQG